MDKKKYTKLDGFKAVSKFIKSIMIISVALIIALYYGIEKGWFDINVKYIILPSYIFVFCTLGFFSLITDVAISDEIKKMSRMYENIKKEEQNDE